MLIWIARLLFLGSIWGLKMVQQYSYVVRRIIINVFDKNVANVFIIGLVMFGIAVAIATVGYIVYYERRNKKKGKDRLYIELRVVGFIVLFNCFYSFIMNIFRFNYYTNLILESMEIITLGIFILLEIPKVIGGLDNKEYEDIFLIKDFFKKYPYIDSKEFLAALVSFLAAAMFFALQLRYGGYYRIATITVLFLGLLILSYSMQYVTIKLNTERILNNEELIEDKALFFSFKTVNENLHLIEKSVHIAVEKQLASERLKTELITNVSHDIKTPLTSVINYIDLLKKEEAQNPKSKPYIEVLEKKAQNLKTLIDDLVEASKASTGNLPVYKDNINLYELINQVIGDYDDIFIEKGLNVIVDSSGVSKSDQYEKSEDKIMVYTDGRHLYRIIHNLFSNVAKYGLEGTRVYIDIQRDKEDVILTVKNISKEQLNIDTNELMERFVRGDASRKTEGSGLGLYIAQSLTELIGGEFSISINGDLFSAKLIIRDDI